MRTAETGRMIREAAADGESHNKNYKVVNVIVTMLLYETKKFQICIYKYSKKIING